MRRKQSKYVALPSQDMAAEEQIRKRARKEFAAFAPGSAFFLLGRVMPVPVIGSFVWC